METASSSLARARFRLRMRTSTDAATEPADCSARPDPYHPEPPANSSRGASASWFRRAPCARRSQISIMKGGTRCTSCSPARFQLCAVRSVLRRRCLATGAARAAAAVEKEARSFPARILSTPRRLRNWSPARRLPWTPCPVAGDRLADGRLSVRAPSGWAQGTPLKPAAAFRSPAGRGGAGSVKFAVRMLTHSSCRKQRGGGDDGRASCGGRSQSRVQASGSLGHEPPDARRVSWGGHCEDRGQAGGLGGCRRRRCGTAGSRSACRAYSSRPWAPRRSWASRAPAAQETAGEAVRGQL